MKLAILPPPTVSGNIQHFETSTPIRLGLPNQTNYGTRTPILIPLPPSFQLNANATGDLTIRHRLISPLNITKTATPRLTDLRLMAQGDYPPTRIPTNTSATNTEPTNDPTSPGQLITPEWQTLTDNIQIGTGILLTMDAIQTTQEPVDILLHIELRNCKIFPVQATVTRPTQS